jgi:hypothetical protein
MSKHVKITLYITAMVLFIGYMFSANYVFNIILKDKKEARLADIPLPIETFNVRSNIEGVKKVQLDWKDALHIRGWVFKKDRNYENRDVYLVLKQALKSDIFKIDLDSISRPDVPDYFQMEPGVDNFGFELYVPFYLIQGDNYQIGFIVKDETGASFSISHMDLQVSNDNASVTYPRPLSDVEYIFHQQAFTIINPSMKLQGRFEKIVQNQDFLTLQGWGFIDGLNTESIKSYIFLKNRDRLHVFESRVHRRPDVTKVKGSASLNLDSSGFLCQIPIKELDSGKYKLGIYLVKGSQAGVIYSKDNIVVGDGSTIPSKK